MNIVQHILNFLNSVPQGVWEGIISVIVSAVSVSGVTQAIKKFFSVNGEKKMIVLTTVFSMISGAVVYLIAHQQDAPWIVPVIGFITLGMSQPVYFLFVKPLSIKLGAFVASQIAQATKIVEARAALVPQDGIPAPQPSQYDFK